MKQLKAKLYELEVQKRRAEGKAGGGRQQGGRRAGAARFAPMCWIRARIKDLRTGVETGNTQAVLDGGLDGFIEASLKQGL